MEQPTLKVNGRRSGIQEKIISYLRGQYGGRSTRDIIKHLGLPKGDRSTHEAVSRLKRLGKLAFETIDGVTYYWVADTAAGTDAGVTAALADEKPEAPPEPSAPEGAQAAPEDEIGEHADRVNAAIVAEIAALTDRIAQASRQIISAARIDTLRILAEGLQYEAPAASEFLIQLAEDLQ
jgi:hypothetical protein